MCDIVILFVEVSFESWKVHKCSDVVKSIDYISNRLYQE